MACAMDIRDLKWKVWWHTRASAGHELNVNLSLSAISSKLIASVQMSTVACQMWDMKYYQLHGMHHLFQQSHAVITRENIMHYQLRIWIALEQKKICGWNHVIYDTQDHGHMDNTRMRTSPCEWTGVEIGMETDGDAVATGWGWGWRWDEQRNDSLLTTNHKFHWRKYHDSHEVEHVVTRLDLCGYVCCCFMVYVMTIWLLVGSYIDLCHDVMIVLIFVMQSFCWCITIIAFINWHVSLHSRAISGRNGHSRNMGYWWWSGGGM